MGARGKPLDAIDHAYRVFRVAPPRDLGVCTICCMDPSVERAMLHKSQAQLTLDDVREWRDAAAADKLGFDQIAWVLPRMLELLAEGEEISSNGNEVALSRLPLAGFPAAWAEEQVTALILACHAIFDRHLARLEGGLDDLLCMFSLGGLPVAPLISRLDALPDVELAEILYAEWRATGGNLTWHTTFWDDHRERDRLDEWYSSPMLEDRMAALGYAGNDKAATVSDALVPYTRGHRPR